MTRVSFKTLDWIPLTTKRNSFGRSCLFTWPLLCLHQVLLMEYLDVKNSRSATEPSSQLSYASTGSEFAAFFAKKKPQRAKQSLFKWGRKYLCAAVIPECGKRMRWSLCLWGRTPESPVSSTGLNLPPMPLAWVPTWGSRGENSTARVENCKVRMRRVAGWWMEWGEVMQMADELQGCRLRGRVGEYEMQESEGIINWTRFLFFFCLNTTAS